MSSCDNVLALLGQIEENKMPVANDGKVAFSKAEAL